MAAPGKRMRASTERVDRSRLYSVEEAVELLASLPKVKFRESLDVAIRLGIDPRKSEQSVRGSVELPHGLGREVRVAVFADGEQAEAARQAGADLVGMDDLAEQVKAGQLDFDLVLATPAAMQMVGRLGPILGPRGLMPSPRNNTVARDMAQAVASAKSGQVRFRNDRYGIVHGSIGRLDFAPASVRENLDALVDGLRKAKPSSTKGVYLRSISLSSTMGPGLRLDPAQLGS